MCSLERNKNKRLRTQIRLGELDIELWLKQHEDDYWERFDPDHFGDLPEPELDKRTVSPPQGKSEREER